VCQLAVDSIFMMPHLGVLATVDEPAAAGLFERDCIVPLGAVVAPFGSFPRRGPVLRVEAALPGERRAIELERGGFARLELAAGRTAELELSPARGVDLGEGPGRARTVEVRGGEVGIVFDCRGRPLTLPADASARRRAIASWLAALGLGAGPEGL
jgi:hypothetical protein